MLWPAVMQTGSAGWPGVCPLAACDMEAVPGLVGWLVLCFFISCQLFGLLSFSSFFLESFLVCLRTSSDACLYTEMQSMQVHSLVYTFTSHVTLSGLHDLPQ